MEWLGVVFLRAGPLPFMFVSPTLRRGSTRVNQQLQEPERMNRLPSCCWVVVHVARSSNALKTFTHTLQQWVQQTGTEPLWPACAGPCSGTHSCGAPESCRRGGQTETRLPRSDHWGLHPHCRAELRSPERLNLLLGHWAREWGPLASPQMVPFPLWPRGSFYPAPPPGQEGPTQVGAQ